MQIVKFIVACMPLAILASPVEQHGTDLVDREASPDGLADAAGFSEKRDDSNELFRRNIDCAIIGSSPEVFCRESANRKSNEVTKFKVGSEHSFKCAVVGECVKLNGKENCSWDKADRKWAKDCWVNGHYTDTQCNLNTLPRCG